MSDEFRLSEDLMARRRARDNRDGRRYATHEDGLCGYMGSLCSACHEDERLEMLEWARTRPRPEVNEDIGAYWKRIGGAFYDAWYDAARAQYA